MTYRDRLLTCPRCGKTLERRTRRDSWPCRACGGAAVQLAELVRVLARYAPHIVRRDGAATLDTATRPSAEPPLTCAACGQGMRPVWLHGVALDRCDKDQLVWFDARDLDRVIEVAIADHEARKGWRRKLRDLLFAN